MQLHGKNFVLRRWQLSDAPSLQKTANDRRVSSTLFDRFPYPYSLAHAENFINMKRNEDPITCFVIDIAGEVAGVISFEMRADVYRKTPLMGYWLSPAYWGKGIMTEAVGLMANYGFNHLDIICIQANAFGTNAASMRVLEKAGFVKSGILPKATIKDGVILDEHLHTLHPL